MVQGISQAISWLGLSSYLRRLLGFFQVLLRKNNWKVGKYRYSPRYIRAPSYQFSQFVG